MALFERAPRKNGLRPCRGEPADVDRWGSVPHYHAFFGLGLSAPEITDLVAYLQAL